MESSLDGVIFDCDGTLVQSEELLAEVLVEGAAEEGLSLSVGEAIRLFRGTRMSFCVEYLERRLGRRLPDTFLPEIRRRTSVVFRERLQPVEGALELIQSLRVPVCVASSGPREKTELSLSLTGLLPYFVDRIFSSYDIESWKPDPGLFLHAARSMGVAPSKCAVVEDSLPGINAGVAAGMTVFALCHGPWADPIPGGVIVFRSLGEIQAALAESIGDAG